MRLLLVLIAALGVEAQTFVPGPEMAIERTLHTATMLRDGRVLIAGGHPTDPACEIYDPATRTMRATGSMTRPRYRPTATLLPDGRVLIAGGMAFPDSRGLPFGSYGDDTTEIFDPATETFSPGPRMATVRMAHASVLLRDGRVLVTGGGSGYVSGFSYSVHPRAESELFDPLTRTFAAAAPMITPRSEHTATRLVDGRVLVVGLSTRYTEHAAELFSADATSVTPLSGAAARVGHTATLLGDGRVLLAGGDGQMLELFDPAGDTFTNIGTTRVGRYHAAVLLADGRVLLTALTDAELVDPVTGTVTTIAPMREGRWGHTATLLPSGEVLLAGGRTNTTEIFSAFPKRKRRPSGRLF